MQCMSNILTLMRVNSNDNHSSYVCTKSHRIRCALHEHAPQKEGGGWEVPHDNSPQDTRPPPTRRHSVPSS